MRGEAARGSPARDAEQGQDQSGDGPGRSTENQTFLEPGRLSELTLDFPAWFWFLYRGHLGSSWPCSRDGILMRRASVSSSVK